MATTRGVGRNAACPCGSGRKFKQCCEAKRHGMSLTMRVAVIGAVGIVLAGIVMGFSSFRTDTGPAAGLVWSPEHGHYH